MKLFLLLQRSFRYILSFVGIVTVLAIYHSMSNNNEDFSRYDTSHSQVMDTQWLTDMKRNRDKHDMSWEDIQVMRKTDISDGCKMIYGRNASTRWRNKHTLPFFHGHTFVDQKNKIMYCTIAKAGCTNLKKMMVLHAGAEEKSLKSPDFKIHKRVYDENYGIRNLETFTSSEIDKILKTYQKVTFVRDPFERIVSAYRDKFESPEDTDNLHFKKKYGTHIIEQHRENPSELSLKKGHDVKFVEFVKHLIDTYSKEKHNNPHWDRFETLCAPCHIQYDVVGKLETFNDDIVHVFPERTLDKYDRISSKSKRRSNSSSKDYVSQYFEQIPKHLVKKLYKAYEKDFLIYGYRFNMDLLR